MVEDVCSSTNVLESLSGVTPKLRLCHLLGLYVGMSLQNNLAIFKGK